MFNVGDRIKATAGVCPGHYGVVTGIKSATVVNVTYDGGRTDSIYTNMLELVSKSEEFEIDAGG